MYRYRGIYPYVSLYNQDQNTLSLSTSDIGTARAQTLASQDLSTDIMSNTQVAGTQPSKIFETRLAVEPVSTD